MLEILQYSFMQRAFIIGVLIAIITPCIGIVVVLKRLSMIGDSLSHSSLAGVAAGLVGGFNPILGAVMFSVLAAFSIEKIRKSFPRYAEIAIAIIMSSGIGIAGILSGFVSNSANFNSFLFGSIVAVSDFELYTVIILSIVVILVVSLLYKELFYITFDEEAARISGIPVKFVNCIFTLLTAITIAISSRTVGTLVISSLMVLPVAAAMQLANSFKETLWYSIGFAILYMVTGLTISYYLNLKPGATIVIVGVIFLITAIIYKSSMNALIKRKLIAKKG